jgi:hypothetical protein
MRKIQMLTAGVAAPLAAALVAGLGCRAQPSHREARAVAAWTEAFGEPATLLSRFPRQSENETARQIGPLAAGVGISLDGPAGSAFSAIRSDLVAYLSSVLERAEAGIDRPPDAVVSFLAEQGPAIRAVIAKLARAEPPRWGLDLGRGEAGPVPPVIALLQLDRLAGVVALERTRFGDRAGAEQALEACSNLEESLSGRPEVVSQLTAVAAARIEAGLLRKIAVEPGRWRTPLAVHDYRQSLLAAIQVEAWQRATAVERAGGAAASRWVADSLDATRVLILAFRDAPVSDGDGAGFRRRIAARWTPDNLSTTEIPNLINAWKRIDRLVIDRELTDKILQARMLARGGWPAAIPGVRKSACVAAHWVYRVGPDQRMRIALSRKLRWPGQPPPILPLRYVSERWSRVDESKSSRLFQGSSGF